MNRRLVVLLVLMVGCAFTFSSAAAAEPPTNDVPFDLESTIGLAFLTPFQVFNVYWDDHWNDPGHNAGFSSATLDAATQKLTESNYFDKLSQYGVPDITWAGSAFAASFPCGGQPGDTTNSVSVFLFAICEASTPFIGVPLAVGLPLPGSLLVPNPTGQTIYNIILPRNTTIDDFGSRSCDAYGAYHFQVPSVAGFPIYFAVIPSACSTSPATLMKSISHEDVEAATDPLPLFHWIDDSTMTPGLIAGFASIPGLLRAGEASDLCSSANPSTSSPFADVPVTFGGVAMNVASYWSNFDNACVVGPSRVVEVAFETSGLPSAGATLTIGGTPQHVSPGGTVTANLREGTAFSFGDVSASAGSRFRAAGAGCAGTVTFPAGNTTADAAEEVTCSYTHEVFVRIATAPAAAATGNVSLTSSQWVTVGTILAVDADALVAPGAGSRYDFRSWNDGSILYTTPNSSYVITSPVTITATYQLQHLVGFDQTGIPGGTTWHVTVGLVPHVGPFSMWANDGSTQNFTYETLVADASVSTTHYALTGTSTPSPLTVSAPTTVVGSYFADTTPPVITVADTNAEATGPSGAVVTFTASVSDPDDTAGPVTCSPASGSGFSLGSTLVTCNSTDTHSNTGTATFHVIVHDTTPPVVTVPANKVVNATMPSGAIVSFTATASDLVDVTDPATCVPASGGTFPIGHTTVTCNAVDNAGNHAVAKSFDVYVKGAAAQLTDLLASVTGTAPGTSLADKVKLVQGYVAANNKAAACTGLDGFISEVAAQKGKKLTAVQAASFTAQAVNIKNTLGC